MSDVFLLSLRIDQYVVEVYDNKDVEEFPENVVDKRLPRRWCISKTERHNQIFVMSETGSKSRLPFIAFRDTYLIVRAGNIKLAELLCTLESILQLSDQGQRVAILDSHVVQASVVDTEPKGSIFLRNEDDGVSRWRL